MDYLKNADWNGNIRELRNTIETAIILAGAETLQLEDVKTDPSTSDADTNLKDLARIEAPAT